jgi:hypothetical protein
MRLWPRSSITGNAIFCDAVLSAPKNSLHPVSANTQRGSDGDQYLSCSPPSRQTRHPPDKAKNPAVILRIGGWITFDLKQRTITVHKDADALAQAIKLDGCYVLKTDLSKTAASKEIIHERYKDLALVEWVFRQSKTVHLEMRPIHVRLKSRTRGHGFVVMLAYSIIQALAQHWRHLDLTVQEGLDQLATLCLNEITLPDRSTSCQLPTPRDTVQKLLDAAHVHLPTKIVPKNGNVTKN